MGRCWNYIVHPKGIHPWRWRFLALWVVSFTLIVSWAVGQNGKAREDLCQTKKNAQTQIVAQRQYLADLKHGVRTPISGITANDIKLAIQRQQAYISAIHSC